MEHLSTVPLSEPGHGTNLSEIIDSEQNAESKQPTFTSKSKVLNERKSTNQLTESIHINSLNKTADKVPSTQVTDIVSNAVSTNTNQHCNVSTSAERHILSKQQKDSDNGCSCDLNLNSTDLTVLHGDDGTSNTLGNATQNEKEDDAIRDTSCTPIILSVRGNATDIDGATDLSTVSSCSSTSSNSVIDTPSVHTEPTDTNRKIASIVESGPASKRFFITQIVPTVESNLLNTMPSRTDMHLSASKKDSALQPSLSASSLLQSVVSNIPGSNQSLPVQSSNQSSKIAGDLVKYSVTKSSSVVRNVGNNVPSYPVPPAAKIVFPVADKMVDKKSVAMSTKVQSVAQKPENLTASSCNDQQNISDSDDNFDAGKLCETIVSTIFTNFATEDRKGMTSEEVLKTHLLDSTKKPRENCEKPFVCNVCGDEFYLEEMLHDHFARKTFVLSYLCHDCDKILTFYNKCKFWLHLRLERPHLVNEETLQSENNYFRMRSIFESESELAETPVSNFLCKVCHNDFDSKKERALHIKQTSQYLYTCNKCSLLLANQCALAAHSAIHEKTGSDNFCPHHICPQCGEDIDLSGGLRVLFEHLDSCFHFNTRFVMSCECGTMCSTTSDFKSHFLTSHTKLLYRCRLCGSCFTSSEFYVNHVARTHPKNMTCFTPDKIVLCTICKEGFPNYLKLKAHVDGHADKVGGLRKKVLMCFLCNSFFSDPKSLCSHVEKQHVHRPKRCTICFGLFESRQNLVQHIVSKTCSPNKLPNKLHICLDNPSHLKNVDVNWSTYKQVFRPSENMSNFKRKFMAVQSITNVASDMPVKGRVGPSSSKKAVASTVSTQISAKSTVSSTSMANSPLSTPTPRTVSSTPTSIQTFAPGPSNSASSSPNITAANAPSVTKTPVTKSPKSTPGELGVDKKKFPCHFCKICLTGRQMYDKHVMIHKSSGVEMDSRDGHCTVCKKVVGPDLIQFHMKEHQMQGVVICSLCQSRNFNSMSAAIKHARNMCNYTIVVTDGARFVRCKQFVNKKKDTETSTDALHSENENNSDTTAVPDRATVFPCLMCGLAFTSKEDKEDHVSRFHDGTRTLYFCLVCKRKGVQKCFAKKNLLSKHISRKHRIVNPSQIAKSIHVEEQNVTSGRVVPAESSEQSNGDAPPPKRLRLANEGEFMCGKCGFSSEDSKVFEDHIVTHNPKKEPQCPECGLCFTVLAALKKHLFVVHKIKAMDEYLQKKGMLSAEEEIDEDDDDDSYSSHVSDLLDNSSRPVRKARKRRAPRPVVTTFAFGCTVCHRSYVSEAVLQKHMRTHGMAFIRSKRLDKS